MTKSTQKSREVRLLAHTLKKIAFELHQTKQNYKSYQKSARTAREELEKIRADDALILKNTINNFSTPLNSLRKANKELTKEVARLRLIQHKNLLSLRRAARNAMEYHKSMSKAREKYRVEGNFVIKGRIDI